MNNVLTLKAGFGPGLQKIFLTNPASENSLRLLLVWLGDICQMLRVLPLYARFRNWEFNLPPPLSTPLWPSPPLLFLSLPLFPLNLESNWSTVSSRNGFEVPNGARSPNALYKIFEVAAYSVVLARWLRSTKLIDNRPV